MIQNGKKVKINYTLNVDGEIVDSTKDGSYEYVHGQDNILPGLKKGLEGMRVDEEKTIVVDPEEAYGEERKEAYTEVPRSVLAKDIKPEIGMALEMQMGNGQKKIAKISGVRDDTIIMNLNHPLAGKTLMFDVKVMDVS